MTSYTIGIYKSFEEMQVLATLSNSAGMFSAEAFESLKESLINQMYERLGADKCIMCLERQDAPETIDTETE